MTYPHRLVATGGDTLLRCRCGLAIEPNSVTGEDYGDDCPAALRLRVAELERHVGSIIKARAEGYEAGRAEERAAVVTYLGSDLLVRRWNESVGGARMVDVAIDAIERGLHREGA